MLDEQKQHQPDNDQPQIQSQPDEVEELKEERDEYKAGWQRAVADYQNLIKDNERRRSELVRRSEAQILAEFIPVYDHFKKAFADHTDTRIYVDDADHADVVKKWMAWKQGIGFIKKQFGDVLKNHGIEEIKTVGEKFDHLLHEIVGEEEADVEEGTVVREVEGGYVMGERIIKVAKVIVSKKSSNSRNF